MPFIDRFRRITHGGSYIPAVDGLRCMAVFMVAFCMHLGNFIKECTLGIPYDASIAWHRWIMEGGYGVSLFFMISGFIVTLPFARSRFLGEAPVSLRAYFLRRLTRIEPPYVVSLVIYLIVRVWILHYDSLASLFPHFMASLFYVHNLVYGYASSINGVAWSLEVEIQFYLLAPLLSSVFFIRSQWLRRGILFVAILAGSILTYYRPFTVSVLDKGSFFLVGMLVADAYISWGKTWQGKHVAIAAVILFVALQGIEGLSGTLWKTMFKTTSYAVLIYVALVNDYLKKWLGNPYLVVIGAMCYSIYLVHMGIFGLMRHGFFQYRFTGYVIADVLIHYVIGMLAALIPSALFYQLVERPTMRRYWYRTFLPVKP